VYTLFYALLVYYLDISTEIGAAEMNVREVSLAALRRLNELTVEVANNRQDEIDRLSKEVDRLKEIIDPVDIRGTI